MKVSIEIEGNMCKMHYEVGESRMSGEHKYWSDDLALLLSVVRCIDERTSTDKSKLDTIKRVIDGKSRWSDLL